MNTATTSEDGGNSMCLECVNYARAVNQKKRDGAARNPKPMPCCPECKSTNVLKTWESDDDSFFDEYECGDCGLCLDLFEGEFIVARST